MKLFFEKDYFILQVPFEKRFIAKNAGFNWNVATKRWFTKELSIINRIKDLVELDVSARAQIEKSLIVVDGLKTDFEWPENLTPREYQTKAAKFLVTRKKAYANMDPGTGKSIVAALVINYFKKLSNHSARFLYICPPFLVENMKAEFERWVLGHHEVSTLGDNRATNILIIPDSMINKKEVQALIADFASKKTDTVLFYDEAHRIKEASSLRSKAFYKNVLPLFERAYLMSGTPSPNSRPMELFAPLHYLAPSVIDFKNKFQFGVKYCAAFQGTWGWDFSGASNTKELAERIKAFMITMKKEDVLTELPAKTEEIIFIGNGMPKRLEKINKEILSCFSPDDLMKGRIANKLSIDKKELHIATYRKELGAVKAEKSLEFIKHSLESSRESILIFAIHKETIAILKEGLEEFKPLVITGETRMIDRSKLVASFQAGESRVLIGNITAAGIGFTMTKATRVIFVEFSYVPAENLQAMDRAHRIGQHENLLVQYLVFKDSVDATVMQSILKKNKDAIV